MIVAIKKNGAFLQPHTKQYRGNKIYQWRTDKISITQKMGAGMYSVQIFLGSYDRSRGCYIGAKLEVRDPVHYQNFVQGTKESGCKIDPPCPMHRSAAKCNKMKDKDKVQCIWRGGKCGQVGLLLGGAMHLAMGREVRTGKMQKEKCIWLRGGKRGKRGGKMSLALFL